MNEVERRMMSIWSLRDLGGRPCAQLLSRAGIRFQRRYFRVFFLPRMVGGPLFLQKIMYFELIVDGILLFVVRMALQKTFLKSF